MLSVDSMKLCRVARGLEVSGGRSGLLSVACAATDARPKRIASRPFAALSHQRMNFVLPVSDIRLIAPRRGLPLDSSQASIDLTLARGQRRWQLHLRLPNANAR